MVHQKLTTEKKQQQQKEFSSMKHEGNTPDNLFNSLANQMEVVSTDADEHNIWCNVMVRVWLIYQLGNKQISISAPYKGLE